MIDVKCLKIEAYQETACYKKPYAFKVAETYPLPPYSTVKGLIHYILQAKQFYDMAISVQGDYESFIENYQTFRFIKGESGTTMPLKVHLLHNVNLLIHIYTDEEIMRKVYNSILNFPEALSLGRREDLLTVRKVKFVEFQEFDLEDEGRYVLRHNAYVPVVYNLSPTNKRKIKYRLNYKYEVSKSGIRKWTEKIDVYYVENGSIFDEEVIYKDDEGDAIFFHKKVEEVKNFG